MASAGKGEAMILRGGYRRSLSGRWPAQAATAVHHRHLNGSNPQQEVEETYKA